MNGSPVMKVREFIALKEDSDFEGFAGNRFGDFEDFENLIDELEEAGVNINKAKVQLMDPRYGENRLYSDVLFLPFKAKFSYEAMAVIIGSRPDEFGLSRGEKFIRLWWD